MASQVASQAEVMHMEAAHRAAEVRLCELRALRLLLELLWVRQWDPDVSYCRVR